ncbi:MAG: hypothetical protein GY853_16310 [PVC group bacterium]|nr:hypothetical protein [PVC group bacterium]
MKWIDAKEESPTEEGHYLTWNTRYGGYFNDDRFYFDKEGKGYWASWVWDTISHWSKVKPPETS